MDVSDTDCDKDSEWLRERESERLVVRDGDGELERVRVIDSVRDFEAVGSAEPVSERE